MPLTRLQARDQYITGSLIQFLARNIKTAYDIEVSGTVTAASPTRKYPTALTVEVASPDDISFVRRAPSIAVQDTSSGEKDRHYGIGQATIWRHRAFLLSCYPSLDGSGAPCDVAASILRSYVQDAFETECIKIIDYTNPLSNASNILFCDEVMYIVGISDPIDRSQTTALAEEKHRFDVHVKVKFAVIGSLAT